MRTACDKCDGKGALEVSLPWLGVKVYECPKCHGTGVIRHSDEDSDWWDEAYSNSGAGENPCRSDSDAETLPRFDPPMRQPGPFPWRPGWRYWLLILFLGCLGWCAIYMIYSLGRLLWRLT